MSKSLTWYIHHSMCSAKTHDAQLSWLMSLKININSIFTEEIDYKELSIKGKSK